MTCLDRTSSRAAMLAAVVGAGLLAWSCGGGSLTGTDPAVVTGETGTVAASGVAKVSVCHLQDAGYKMIEIGTPALRAHLAHGDKVPVNGSCADQPPATCPCYTTTEIDATSCADQTAVAPLCPQQIYDQYGVPVVEGIGWSCSGGQQSGFYIVYDIGGYSCGSITPTRETAVPLSASEVDGCIDVIRASQLYQTAGCN